MNKEFSVNILTLRPQDLTCNFNLNQKVQFKLRIATIKTTDVFVSNWSTHILVLYI